jgi:hypothetical protein
MQKDTPGGWEMFPQRHEVEVPVSSIKEEVKKKHPCIGRKFSCFAAHLMEQDVF